ncbi:MAG: phospho-sugar mutase [Defluviitaleaceae bacterium]|nr:phospho-sugar mutase [Defluviitaleaceae bacterium]
MEKFQQWLDHPTLDEDTRAELLCLSGNEKEIAERFHKDLEFGTGGLRGIMGAGTNRMNVYTVRRASQGLADYILDKTTDGAGRGVVISYDSRKDSRKFAEETANIMLKNGITAYLFEEMRPTPQLSFAIRHLGCIAGVMVTASHNPPEYNGYKAYWEDGGQLVYPQDEEVIAYVNRTEPLIPTPPAGNIKLLGKELDKAYLSTVGATIGRHTPETNLSIIYTPLHGVGNTLMPQALSNAGFTNIAVVPEQAQPDPNFTTVKSPNPEDPVAFTLALSLAQKNDADIIIATDPDADRMGIMAKNTTGEYELLSGNATGVLLTEHILSKENLPPNAGIISTVVSTRLTQEIAKAHGVAYAETLTGFKHIAAQIRKWEQETDINFIFGFEESFGYMAGDFVRDKDGISASVLICQLAARLKSQGKTLFDHLDEIYKKYGYYAELGRSIVLKGLDGRAKINQMMDDLRNNPPKTLAGIAVGEPYTPAPDVLHFTLEDGSWFCMRPSGTEPKIKIYMGVKSDTSDNAQNHLNMLSAALYTHLNI